MRKHQRKIISGLAIVLVVALVASLLSMILATGAGAVSQADVDALESQKAALQAEQDAMQGRIDELMAQQDAVLQQKEALDEQNELNRQELEIINEQIELYDQMILEKEAELEDAIAAEEHISRSSTGPGCAPWRKTASWAISPYCSSPPVFRTFSATSP